jgi:hydrogenase-4 component F
MMHWRIDALSLLFAGIVCSIALLATCYSAGIRFVKAAGERAPWSHRPVYYALLAFFWAAMLLVVLADNFVLLWFGISATTLATAFLVGYSGEPAALEAAWKYLVLCSVGIALALLGILMLARATADPSALPLARLATSLMVLGFGTKAGLVPMHAWLPDAHSKAPAPISALLSGVLVSCSLYAIVRTLNASAVLGTAGSVQTLLLVLGVASVVVAGGLMLTQRDLKRLLAYSTVEHAGIVALALGFGGPLGTFAALFHLVAHAFAKSTAFFAVGVLQAQRGTTEIGALHGGCRVWPGRLLLGALVALGGMPPFGLFVSELLVIAAGVAAKQWTALGFALVGMLLGFAALARASIETQGGRMRVAAPAWHLRVPIGMTAVALFCAFGVALIPWTPAGALLHAVAAKVAKP